MITETELREAMQHSAARADHRLEQQSSAKGQPNLIDVQGPIDRSPMARRRTWFPLAAAAAVAVVAGGGLMLAAKPGHHSPAAPQRDAAAATPTSGSKRPAVASPHTAVALTNLVTIPGETEYGLGARMETLATPPGLGGLEFMALPAAGFDPARLLTGSYPVSVAGTHGYAGKALIDLIDPHDAQQASKAGAPRNTVAWPAGDGSWLVLQSFMADGAGFTDLPVATLIHDAGQLKVQATPAPLRSGYRARWLPAGLTLTGASASVGNPAVALTLTAGSKSINIELDRAARNAPSATVPTGTGMISIRPGNAMVGKQVPGYSVSVLGYGYGQATVQRVLDGIDFSRLHGPQSGWWTLDQTVNG